LDAAANIVAHLSADCHPDDNRRLPAEKRLPATRAAGMKALPAALPVLRGTFLLLRRSVSPYLGLGELLQVAVSALLL